MDCGFTLLLDMLREDEAYRRVPPEDAAPLKYVHLLTTDQLWEVLTYSMNNFSNLPTPEIQAVELRLSTFLSFELGKRIERDQFREHAAHMTPTDGTKPTKSELEAKIYVFTKEAGYSMEKTMKMLRSHYNLSIMSLHRIRDGA